LQDQVEQTLDLQVEVLENFDDAAALFAPDAALNFSRPAAIAQSDGTGRIFYV
jgi:hypothetical protein